MTALLVILFAAACGDDAPGHPDGGPAADAGPAPVDAGAAPDAGGPADAGEPPDAGASRIDALVARLRAADTIDEARTVMDEVAWAEGWPVVEPDRILFATRWDEAPAAVALVSDLNGWDTSASPAEPVPDGSHWFVVIDVDAATARGAKYKWWGSSDVYRAPPEATAYGFDEFGEHGLVRPPEGSPWRERFPDLRSAHLELPRTVRAYLPAGFTRGAPVRTLLLHDGQNLFHPDAPHGGWRVDETLAAPRFADVLVVAVDSVADRMDAYTHVADDFGSGTVGGRASGYLAMLRDEVLPFVRARYGIGASGASLAIGGSSLGGLVSAFIALEAPELAGCAIAMSPTLGWGAFGPGADDPLLGRFEAVGHGPVAMYLDSGGGVSAACTDPDGDGVFEDADDSDNYCVTVQLRDALASAGYTFGTDLFHWHEPGAPHREDAWAARLPRALDACTAAGWAPPAP